MSRSIPKFESILNRFHPIIYICFVALSLAAVVFLFYTIYNISTTPTGARQPINTSFDQATIEKIEELNTPSDTSHTFSLPEGRINPFI